MANASRPKKSSQRKTSSSTGLPARGAAVDPLELYVALVAGAENLSVTAARGLLRMRQAVQFAQQAAKGALVKLDLDADGEIEWYSSAARAPLLRDFMCLLLLRTIDDFPQHAPAVRRLLARIRRGFDMNEYAFQLREQIRKGPPCTDPWDRALTKPRIDEAILTRIAPVAVWAVREMAAAALRAHSKKRWGRGKRCPVCGAMAYARQGARFLCESCETRWPTRARIDCSCAEPQVWVRAAEVSASGFDVLRCAEGKCTTYELDRSLTAAFNPFWYVKLVRLLDAPYKKSALQSPRG